MMRGGAGNRGRVLVVDDDEVVRLVVRDVLESVGWSVAGCVPDADMLERVRATDAELVLLDVMASRGDGLSLLQLLRDEAPGVGVIVFGTEGARQAARARALGARGRVTKPFDIPELIRVVESAVTGA